MPVHRPIAERFWEKVTVAGPLDCWEWTAATRNGYGVIGYYKKVLKAHRVSYAMAHGIHPAELPSDVIVRHQCDNPPCCNPAHLTAGTLSDNTQDMIRRGRHNTPTLWRDGRCANGHDVTNPANVYLASDGSRRWCAQCSREARRRRNAA